MFDSRNEVIAWAVAICGVIFMGAVVWGANNNVGPFHKVNKPALASSFPPVHVTIITNPQTIGQYTPASVTVHAGQHVIFTNSSDAVHTVTSRKDNGFDSKDIDTGKTSWTLIAPTAPGSYAYYCVYHPLMAGKVVVTG
jgi:plastocyanin